MSRTAKIRAAFGIAFSAILIGVAPYKLCAQEADSSLNYAGASVRNGIFGTELLTAQPSLTRDYDLAYRPGDGSGRFTMFDLKRVEGRGTLTSSFAGSSDPAAPVLTRLD